MNVRLHAGHSRYTRNISLEQVQIADLDQTGPGPYVLVPTVMQPIGRLRWIKPVRRQVCEKQICVFQPLEDSGHVNQVKVACCFSDPRILRAYRERRPIRPAALRRIRA